jgi:hypothetical protein
MDRLVFYIQKPVIYLDYGCDCKEKIVMNGEMRENERERDEDLVPMDKPCLLLSDNVEIYTFLM